MNNHFNIPTPPASRVVSVGVLRSLEVELDLDDFGDETLAEIQLIASRVTDDGADVLISIVIETEMLRTSGQTEVPLVWFENQIRMRSLLNTPSDTSAVLLSTVSPINMKVLQRDSSRRHLATIGQHLGETWGSKRRTSASLRMSTIAWIDLVERFNCDILHHSVNEVRLCAARNKVSHSERTRISIFCTATSNSLISKISCNPLVTID